MYKVAICDDNIMFLEKEKSIIQSIFSALGKDVDIQEYKSGKELINLSKEMLEQYVVIFLDIDMKDMNGIEVAHVIHEKANVKIAFLTAFIDYALAGYRVDAVRYILKDMNQLEDTIRECIEYVLENSKIKNMYCFAFREGQISFDIDDVVVAESQKHYIKVKIKKETEIREYTLRQTLDEFECMIHSSNIVRIHQSCFVNCKYIESIKRYRVTMSDESEYSISQS